MEKISLLLFSRNDMGKALDLIQGIYDYVDEVVLFDSSDSSVHNKFIAEIKEKGLGKVRMHYIVALGYLEPTIMYAFKKCRYNWILLLGTDERPSKEFKEDMHRIVDRSNVSAFAIKRYEEAGKEKRGSYTNWQIRLFRKGRVEFRGLIHEEPIVTGKRLRLEDSGYFIDHVNELRGDTHLEYNQMEKFLRMSYRLFNDRMVDYFYKLTMPSSRRKGLGELVLRSILLAFERLGGKSADDEVSDFYYYIYYYTYSLATNIKSHRVDFLSRASEYAKYRTDKMKEWRAEPDSTEVFEISKILYKEGLINYLGLDDGRVISKLNRRYMHGRVGVSLLMKLLKLRYERGKRWLD